MHFSIWFSFPVSSPASEETASGNDVQIVIVPLKSAVLKGDAAWQMTLSRHHLHKPLLLRESWSNAMTFTAEIAMVSLPDAKAIIRRISLKSDWKPN